MNNLDNLNNTIYNEIIQTGRDVSLIVMHPNTFENLKKEVLENNLNVLNAFLAEDKIRYKGIMVYRSSDVEENIFIVS
jgi:hypothetical protein